MDPSKFVIYPIRPVIDGRCSCGRASCAGKHPVPLDWPNLKDSVPLRSDAERYERKWLIVTAAVGVGVLGPLFAWTTQPVVLVALGILITGFAVLLSEIRKQIRG